MKKNLLFVTQLLPYPDHSGGKVKTLAVIKELAKAYNIYLVCCHDKHQDEKFAQTLAKKVGIHVQSYYWPVVTAHHQKIKYKLFFSLFSSQPFAIYKYNCPFVRDYIKKITTLYQFDVAYFDHNTSVQYVSFLENRQNTRCIFDEHNVDSISAWRMAIQVRWRKNLLMMFMQHFFPFYDALKHYLYEQWMVRNVDVVFAISENDRNLLLQRGARPQNTFVLPVPTEVHTTFRYTGTPQRVLIPALMTWSPNKLGIIWFYKKAWSKIRQVFPKAELWLVGPHPEPDLLAIVGHDRSVHVTGEVDSLVPFYRQSSLVAVPIFMGSGVRIKILQALAAGMPIVSTRVGAEGVVDAEKGTLFGESPDEFAQAIIKILKSPSLAHQLSRAGITLMRKHYSSQAFWNTVKSAGIGETRT